MNGITGASTQTGSPAPVPYNPADVTDLKATGFAFKDGGLSWDQWIDAARTSLDPQIRAQFQELVDLAGGRTHDAAIMDVMARVAAMQQAAQPGATASDRQAALNAMGDQLTTMLRGMDVPGQLSGPLDDAARTLASMPEFANTEWGQALGAVFSSPRAYAAYQIGQVKGVLEGGKDMVTGIISLAAKTLQYSADSGFLGDAGDMARGFTGKLPGWLDEVIPSSQRGEASTAALHAMGKGIYNYLNTHTRGEVARDLGNALNTAWEGVKADHAAARAQGPEAEAEFLGRMTGRIGFEIAATFAGGAGIAGKAGKVGSLAADLGRVGLSAIKLEKLKELAQAAVVMSREAIDLGGRLGTEGRNAIARALSEVKGLPTEGLSIQERLVLKETVETLEESLEISAPRHGTTGNAAAIAQGFGELSAKQQKILNLLSERNGNVLLHRGDVSPFDIAALTAKTGDEFAIFTNGSRRLVLRGNEHRIPLDEPLVAKLKSEGWRWTAHTQPGLDTWAATASAADQNVLRALGQQQSMILNSKGDINIFTQTDISARTPQR